MQTKFNLYFQISHTGNRKDYGEICTASWDSEQDFIQYLRLMGTSDEQLARFERSGRAEFFVPRHALINGRRHEVGNTRFHYFRKHVVPHPIAPAPRVSDFPHPVGMSH